MDNRPSADGPDVVALGVFVPWGVPGPEDARLVGDGAAAAAADDTVLGDGRAIGVLSRADVVPSDASDRRGGENHRAVQSVHFAHGRNATTERREMSKGQHRDPDEYQPRLAGGPSCEPLVEAALGDGTEGAPEAAPYDAVLVSAAFPEVPGPLIDQLRQGGRLVQPIGPGGAEEVILFQRTSEGLAQREQICAARFVRLFGRHGYA